MNITTFTTTLSNNIAAEAASLYCELSGYDAAAGNCQFLDASVCSFENYNDATCVSESEVKFIKKFLQETEQDVNDESVQSLIEILPLDQHDTYELPQWIPDITQPILKGFGRAYFPSYGYNAETKKCERFIWGGMNGNSNSFGSEKECNQMVHVYKKYQPEL